MIPLETQYFSVNKILLLTVGLWPYQQTKLVQLQYIFFSSILIAASIIPFTAFIISKCSADVVLEILSFAFFFPIFGVIYNVFHFKLEIIKDLLEQLQHVWDKIKDDNEIAIVEKYSYIAKCYTITLTIIAICASLLFTLLFWPNILNIVLSINVSRPPRLAFMTDYFIDQEIYFYLIIFHTNATCCIGVIVIVAIGTLCLNYLQYICGMFTIASYRLEHAMEINILQNNILKNQNFIFKRIIYAIDIHRQAMKLSTHLIYNIETTILCLTVLGIASASFNFFQIFQILSSRDNVKEFLMHSLFIAFIISYLFFANVIAQELTDHNNHVFATAYSIRWYTTPLYIQRTILFLLQRGAKEFTLNISGLFDGSMKNFATIMNISISYFTFMYSIQ